MDSAQRIDVSHLPANSSELSLRQLSGSKSACYRLFVMAMVVLLSGYLAVGTSLFGLTSAHAAAGTQATISDAHLTDYNGGTTIKDGGSFKLTMDWSFDEPPTELPAIIDIDLPKELSIKNQSLNLVAPDGTTIIGTCAITTSGDAGAHLQCTLDDDYVTNHPDNLHGGIEIAGTIEAGNTEDETTTFPIGDTTTNEVTILPKDPVQPCITNCEYTGEGLWKSGWLTQDADGSTYVQWSLNIPAPATGLAAGTAIVVTDTTDDPALHDGIVPGSVQVSENAVEQADATGKWGLAGGQWKNVTDDAALDLTVNNATGEISFTTRDVKGKYTLSDGQKSLNSEDDPQAVYRVSLRMKVDPSIKAPTIGTAYRNSYTVTRNGEQTSDHPTPGGAVSDIAGVWGVGTAQGGLLVQKTLAGDAAGEIKKSLAYTINYSVTNIDGSKGRTGSFKVYANEQTASPYFEQGESVTINEVKPASTSAIAWGDPALYLGDDTEPTELPYTFTIDGETGAEHAAIGSLTNIRFENTASLQKTQFKAKKSVSAPGGATGLPETYTLGYDYVYPADGSSADSNGFNDSGSGTLTLDKSGTVETSEQIPVGSKVSLHEDAPAAVPGTTWQNPVISVNGQNVSTFIIDNAQTATVQVTNVLAPNPGSVSWQKADATSGDLVGGSEWQLTAPDGSTTIVTDNDGAEGYAGADTNAAPGEFALEDLAWGEYTLTETKAPTGYTIASPAPTQSFTVNATQLAPSLDAITNERALGSVSWQKTDATSGDVIGDTVPGSDHELALSHWELTQPDGSKLQVIDNGANDADPVAGAVTVDDLPWGEYTLTETAAPTGYELDKTPHSATISQFTLDAKFDMHGSIANERTPGSLTWNKTDATDGAALAGSEWTLTGPSASDTDSSDTAETPSITVVDNGAYDEDPTAGALKVGGLDWGDYTLTESKAPQGYQLSTASKTVTIDAGNAQEGVSFGAVQNDRILGGITWQKADATSGDLIGGSEWGLTAPDGTNSTITDNDGAEGYAGADLNPAPGEFALADLPWGEYTLTESKAPTGYTIAAPDAQADAPTETFTVGAEQQAFEFGVVTNDRISGALQWQKTDAATGAALAGSEWSLTAPDGSTTTIADNGDLDLDKADGRIQLADLAWGEYTVTESKAPAGYVLDSTAHQVTIDADNLTVDLGAITNVAVPPTPNSGDESLARTGLAIGGIAAGVALLVVGAVLLLARRRRHSDTLC